FVVEAARCRFYPVDTFPELSDVEVDLEDALLGPYVLDEHGHPGLHSLTEEAATVPQEQVLGDLLGNRAGAAEPLPLFAGPNGFANGFEVEARVERELLVFGRNDCDRGVWRDVLQTHPLVVGVKGAITFGRRLQPRLQHECACGRINPAE